MSILFHLYGGVGEDYVWFSFCLNQQEQSLWNATMGMYPSIMEHKLASVLLADSRTVTVIGSLQKAYSMTTIKSKSRLEWTKLREWRQSSGSWQPVSLFSAPCSFLFYILCAIYSPCWLFTLATL